MLYCEICNRETEVINRVGDHNVCDDCHIKIQDYVSRLEARADRLEARAARIRQDAESDFRRSDEMASVIPFGQPILVGHHSEKADRRYRERIHNLMRRGFEKLQRAQHAERSAQGARSNHAIYTDDPAAVLKLRDQITDAERAQERMKQCNALVRKVLKMDVSPDMRIERLQREGDMSFQTASALLTPDYMGRYGYQDFTLKNNNANIRRMKQRLAALEARAQIIATADESTLLAREDLGKGIEMEKDIEANRLRLYFPGKPSRGTIALLKSQGFRWSPTNGAWQRHLSAQAEYQARTIAEQID